MILGILVGIFIGGVLGFLAMGIFAAGAVREEKEKSKKFLKNLTKENFRLKEQLKGGKNGYISRN